MLIGVPLGLSSKRGGKSTGFVLTLLLVFAYYLISNLGVAFAKSGKLSPFLGVWGANLIFAAFGIILLQQLAGGGVILNFFTSIGATLEQSSRRHRPQPGRRYASRASPTPAASLQLHRRLQPQPTLNHSIRSQPSTTLVQRMRRLFKTSFPLLLDEYVMRSYAANFLALARYLRPALRRLHFLRTHGRHHPQPDPLHHRRRIPHQPHPLHRLHRHPALFAARRPHHLRRPQPLLRTHRHEGHRHLPLPRRRPHPHPRRRPLPPRSSPSTSPTCPKPTAARKQLRAAIKSKPAQTFLLARPRMDLRQDRRSRRPSPHLLLPVPSTQTATSSPTSPSSSSIPRPSPSSAASSPKTSAGTPSSPAGSSSTAGSAPSPAKL